MTSPEMELAHLDGSTNRFVRTLTSLNEAGLRLPSSLENWSRAHVAGHVARNADALANLVHWARTGERRPMYPSARARAQGIARAATKDATALQRDVLQSADRLRQAMQTLTHEQWERPIHWRHERTEGTARGLILMRWVEVEVHHTDLRAGYTFHDWPDEFVQTMLPRLVEDREVKNTAVPVTLSTGAGTNLAMLGGGPSVTGTPSMLVAWMTGRTALPGAPDLPPWR